MADSIFNQIPDWTSWENQGGGVAVADLDGDGSPELIVLRVDHPANDNNVGFYRVDKDHLLKCANNPFGCDFNDLR